MRQIKTFVTANQLHSAWGKGLIKKIVIGPCDLAKIVTVPHMGIPTFAQPIVV